MILNRQGQSIVEYSMLIGFIVIVLYYMGTGVKRGVQSLVKVTADQVGNQSDADQSFNQQHQGILESSSTYSNSSRKRSMLESGSTSYTTNMGTNEETDTQMDSTFNGGFSSNN